MSRIISTFKANSSIRHLLTKFLSLIFKESAEYKQKRNEFMWRRLGFCLWGAIPLWLCGTVTDFYYWFYVVPQTADVPQALKPLAMKWLSASLIHDVALAPILITLLIFHRTKKSDRKLALIFLCFSWCATLLPEIIATGNGFAMGNSDLWRFVFLIQATLIPVRWHLHLVSQLGVILYYVGVNSALGLQPIEGHQLVSFGWFLMMFWFCLVCNVGVYMYDRLQRAEFESRRELRVFLHAITHDLRAPLMGTAIVLQNLLKKSDSQVSVRRSVIESLLEGNSRQINLINALQAAYTYETHKVKLDCEPLQLATVVASVLTDLEPLLKQNKVILENFVSADLPPVKADAIQLQRVFSNLISNALKHNPHGITLTLNAIKGKKMLCYVQDNGVGMSKKQCERIFELYTRGENARLMPGLGLGLYVCRQIITAHGGKIGVQSQPGIGSTFWFTLN